MSGSSRTRVTANWIRALCTLARRYRRGYWDFMSWVSKKAFYTWIFVALFTTVQANWSAALQHVQQVISQQGAAVTFVGVSSFV